MFITGIMMIFSGLVFTLILTRNLSPEQYGTWNLILGLIIYGLILEPTISYWATRETARNIQSQKTSVFFWRNIFINRYCHIRHNFLFCR